MGYGFEFDMGFGSIGFFGGGGMVLGSLYLRRLG